jgi:hypothetical protein
VVAPSIPYCNYTLGNGQGIFESRDPINDITPIEMQVNQTSAGGGTYFSSGVRSIIGTFTIMKANWTQVSLDPGRDDSQTYLKASDVNATECGFEVCVQKYKASMNQTIFTEDVLDSMTNRTDNGNIDTSDEGALIINVPSAWSNHSDEGKANVFRVEDLPYRGLSEIFFIGPDAGDLVFQGSFFASGSSATSSIMTWIRYLNDNGLHSMVSR